MATLINYDSSDKYTLFHFEHDPDGIVWLQPKQRSYADVSLYCDEHRVPLSTTRGALTAICPVDSKFFKFSGSVYQQTKLANSLVTREREGLRKLKVARIDAGGNAVLAKEHKELNDQYWIDVKLSEATKGLEVMIQAGKRDKLNKKVQLFVDLPNQRLGFDRSSKDNHPTGLFTEVVAKFKDSATIIKKKD
jgi:hypothetical protein